MGLFDSLAGSGYFQVGRESEFPWSTTDRMAWYSLFVIEDGKIERYGFTPSIGSKTKLYELLVKLIAEQRECLLLGVWTGQWRTDLFVLDPELAVGILKSLLPKPDPPAPPPSANPVPPTWWPKAKKTKPKEPPCPGCRCLLMHAKTCRLKGSHFSWERPA